MPKAPIIDQTLLLDRLLKHISQVGPSKSKDLCAHLHISQSTVSRLIGQANDAVLRIGKGRETLYACRRLGAWGNPKVPITWVSETGRPIKAATLHPLSPQGFYLESHVPQFSRRTYKSWPYFLDDLRPSGFLGRLIPRLYPDAGFPDDILAWSDDHCLLYLTSYGWDIIGNLIVGEKSFEENWKPWATNQNVVAETDRESEYPKNADLVLSKGIPGSSAAGEQPKFLSLLRTEAGLRSVLVKFSPPIADAISRRVADLLICEHIVHDVLKKHGKVSLCSQLIRGAGRLFLEMERFDRNMSGGRRGVISLRALDLEFVGQLSKTWSDTAQALLNQNKITPSDYESIVWLEVFGKLIGNTDRHHGNISFFCDGEQISGLAPVYDMLPMMYAPQQNQLVARSFDPEPPKYHEIPTWSSAVAAARDFWSQVQGHPEISGEFRSLTTGNETKLS